MTVQSPQGIPPQPPPRKGLSPLAWVGIGCAVIVVMGTIVMVGAGIFAAHKLQRFAKNPGLEGAKLVVSMNPDLETKSIDEGRQTMTVYNKKTGETVTMGFDDLKKGRFKMSSDKGTASVDLNTDGGSKPTLKVTDEKGQTSTFTAGTGAANDLPSWVPVYPGGKVQGSVAANSAQSKGGNLTVTTSDSPEKVFSYYESQLKAGGWKIENNMNASGGGSTMRMLTATNAGGKQTLNFIVTADKDGTQISTNYGEKP